MRLGNPRSQHRFWYTYILYNSSDTQIAKLTSSTKPTVANIRAGNQSQPITEFRNPMDLGLCSYEDLELLVEKGQRKAEKEKKAKEKAAQLSSTTVS